jgi:hypothetical protein
MSQWRIAVANIPGKAIDRCGRFRIGFCDVTGPTNQRSLVAALIPAHAICGHKVPTLLFAPHNDLLALLWLGIANSFCLDFVARKKVALSMSYTVVDSLPLPRVYSETPLEQAIARRALLLTATGPEMEPFWNRLAPLVGLTLGADRPEEDLGVRKMLRAELDVLVARDFFGLSLDEMRYLLDPEDILGPECGFESFGALKRAEKRAFGCFISRDMIVERWTTLTVPVGSELELA